jgi:hypothetical protein
MTIDIERIKQEHGLAQARAETAAAGGIGQRVGTVSFKQGHRSGFWRGVEYALINLARDPSRTGHDAEARLALEWAMRDVSKNMAAQTGEYKADVIAQAQVHATLALVEQQRIANLMDYLRIIDETPGPEDDRRIREVLGL